MLSRVAAQLYWLSRYLERAENMARILEVGQSFALLSTSDSNRGAPDTASEPLVITDTVRGLERAPARPTRRGLAVHVPRVGRARAGGGAGGGG